MVSYDYFVLRTASIVNCLKARSLVDYLYWTQAYPEALALAQECCSLILSLAV